MPLSAKIPEQDPPPGRTLTISAHSAGLVLCIGLLAWLLDTPALAPPLGVTAYLCARQPAAEVCHPRNVLAGHVLGLFAGYAALFACQAQSLPGALSGPFTVRHAFASGIAIFLTVWSTESLRVPHPPAAATTLVVSLGLLPGPFAPLSFLVGTLGIVIVSELHRRFTSAIHSE